MSLLDGRRLVVIDIETSGWAPSYGHTVLEIARVTLESGRIVEEWSSLVGPPRSIAVESTRVHGITEAMLAGAPEPAEVGRQLMEACRGHMLVFHNAAFDLSFCAPLIAQSGLPPLHNPVIDTLGLARGLFGSGSNSLGELAVRLGIEADSSHRALADARTTAGLLLALAPRWEQERGVRSLAELAGASQDAIRVNPHRVAPNLPVNLELPF